MLFTAPAIATQAASEQKHLSIAAGLSPFFRGLGQALGVVIGGSAFQNILKHQLQNVSSPSLRNDASLIAKAVERLPEILKSMPIDSAVRARLLVAFDETARVVWAIVTAFAVAGGIISLLIRQLDTVRHPDNEGLHSTPGIEKGPSTVTSTEIGQNEVR